METSHYFLPCFILTQHGFFFFLKKRGCSCFVNFLEAVSLTCTHTVPPSCSSAASGQHSTNKRTSSDGLIKCGEFANKKKNPQNCSFPNLSANLWPRIQCCCGADKPDLVWSTRNEEVFGCHHLVQRTSLRSTPLPMFSAGSLSIAEEDPVRIMIVLLGCPSARHFSWVFWIMVNCWTVTLVANGSVVVVKSLNFLVSVWYSF